MSKLVRRRPAVLASLAVIIGTSVMGGAAANAAPPIAGDDASVLAAVAQQADERGYIVLTPSDGQSVDGSVFYPTGPISDDTLVVITDGSGALPNGLTTKLLDSLVEQQRSGSLTDSVTEIDATPTADAVVMADRYAWASSSAGFSQPFQGGSVIGWDATARASYSFHTNTGFNARASAEGLGYYRGYNGSTFGTWSAYYYLGIAGPAGTGTTVPWGNVAAVKSFRAICTQTTLCGGYFS